MNKLIKKAFTLIELLVVIAIIGILSGLIVVSMSGVTQKANIAKSQIFSNSLRNALMLNIVGEWKFEGDTNDTWSGNNGTWSGPTAPNTVANYRPKEECVSGQCLNFDGVDDVVNTTYAGNFGTGEFTISFWVKLNTLTPAHQNIIGNRLPQGANTWWAGIFSDGRINFDSSGNSIISNTGEIVTNTWYYIIFTRTGTTFTTYKNGVSVKTGSQPNNLTAGTNMAIGAIYGASERVNGLIDDVRIYNATIPTSQIKEQYFTGLKNLLTSGQINGREYSERINLMAIDE
jgi:prepilin-type N-terminal cleavage/methylation domain-containing protein